MRTITWTSTRILTCAIGLALFALVPIASAQVRDSGSFFSISAAQKASDATKAIKQKFGTSLLIETFPTVPTNRIDEVKKMDRDTRNRFFAEWSRERMKATDVKDILILICKQPPHLQVTVGQELERRVFPPSDRDKLSNLLLGRFKEKQYDDGILEAVKLVRDTLEDRAALLDRGTKANEVRDFAGFFSAAAIDKATQEMKRINREYRGSVAVETFAHVPPDSQKQVSSMGEAQRTRFFQSWAQDRATAGNFKGISILICKTPPHLQVIVSSEVQKKAFTASDREKLQKLLLSEFRAKRFDEGLADAMALIANALRTNLGATGTTSAAAKTTKAAPPTTKVDASKTTTPAKSDPPGATKTIVPSAVVDAGKPKEGLVEKVKEKVKQEVDAGPNFRWVLYLLAGLVGLWILIGLMRAIFGRRQQPQYGPPPSQQGYGGGPPQPRPPAPYPSQPQPQGGYPYQGSPQMGPGYGGGGGGGGGFLTGMLGGMFGAAAGNWVYDSVFRRSSHSPSWGGPTAQGAEPGHTGGYSSAPSGNEQGFGGSGGSFGEESGMAGSSGGDFGEPEGETTAGSSGGDFGEPADAQTDFGAPDDVGGSDFSADSGGDFGGDSGDSGGDSGGSGGGDF